MKRAPNRNIYQWQVHAEPDIREQVNDKNRTDQSIYLNSHSIYHHPTTQIVHPKSARTNTMWTLATNTEKFIIEA